MPAPSTYALRAAHRTLLADTQTPIGVYLRLRDRFPNTVLLESSDHHGHENSFSHIACDPIAMFRVADGWIDMRFPDGARERMPAGRDNVIDALAGFIAAFQVDDAAAGPGPHGLFGYVAYDAVRYFEDIELRERERVVPDILFHVYRHVVTMDHFRDEMRITGYGVGEEPPPDPGAMVDQLRNRGLPQHPFRLVGEETANGSDAEFLAVLAEGKRHCQLGDVFQIVLSRRFQRGFQGDDLNVYRALRSVNPSPYLFHFDFGDFKIMGSSPEAQLVVRDGKAVIHPIAGTFRRTGDDAADAALAAKLLDDRKENAEHVMLVDLARNDLSKRSEEVQVEVFKEVQFYSHVIHLVSKVSGKLHEGVSSLGLTADTFPAGTLSGAPKHRAMQLIDGLETTARGYYGGGIGLLGFNGEVNLAIMIRSFLSRNNTLTYQAGAGVVAESNVESELQEVANKLAALRKALEVAQQMD